MIDERIRELSDWRGEMLSQLRALIKQADLGLPGLLVSTQAYPSRTAVVRTRMPGLCERGGTAKCPPIPIIGQLAS
ncbi:MAG: hypothetical protein JWM91_565 [Rhodospirillales bacterium]|nr:hypothetical protein [Rhodospirillales bacterium]